MGIKIGDVNNVQNFGRVIFVDPNPDKNNIISPDNYSIDVELTTSRKQRRAIEITSTGTTISTGSEVIPISFINGSKINKDGKRSLTTHYTEINTNFNKEESDLETLGIKDIQIEFNTSQAPMVTINFIDVRGKLFELNNNSPYSVFFEMPFPIFNLRVKGFYGKAITYKLHLLKFNGSFNNSSGTFDVKCQFVGYTYAFLSDILIGYLKAIPYTKKGKLKVNKLNEENNYNFTTFNELDIGISKFESKLTDLKTSNSIKELAVTDNVIDELNFFKDSFKNSLDTISNEPNETSGNRLITKITDGLFLSNELSSLKQLIDFNSTNNNFIKELNKKINNGFNIELFKLKSSINVFKGVKISDFLTADNEKKSFLLYKNFNGDSKIQKAQVDEEYFNDISNKLFYYYDNKIIDKDFTLYIYDLRLAIKNIDDVIKKVKSNKEVLIPELGELFLENIKENFPDENFNSSIGDFFKILCNHVDIFMDVIREVAVEAEKDKNERKNQLNNLIDNDFINYNTVSKENDLTPTIGDVKAFPDYRVRNKDNSIEDLWIGNKAPNMPEVLFVEDLLRAMIKSKINDEKVEELLNKDNSAVQWYPVSPFDINYYNKINPYEVIEDGNNYDIIRLVTERLFIAHAYGNKDLSNEERISLAKLEANNVFKSIKNKVIKSSLNNLGEVSSRKAANSIIDIITGKKNVNYLTNFTTSNGIVKLVDNDSGKFNYKYIHSVNDNTITYIPLNSVNNIKSDFNGDFIIGNNGQLSSNNQVLLRNNGNIYFSNIKNNIKNDNITINDDGSTFIDIIDKDILFNKNYELHSYGLDILNNKNIGIKSININKDRIETNIFNGNTGCNEIFSVNKGNSTLNSYNLFYKNNDSTTLGKRNVPMLSEFTSNYNTEFDTKIVNGVIKPVKNEVSIINSVSKKNDLLDLRSGGKSLYEILNTDDIKAYSPHIGFISESNYYSLFGSDFYNSQTDIRAKALLFLNSLQFDFNSSKSFLDDINPIDNNTSANLISTICLKLFDTKNGFVEVPYSWVLLIGGYLTRMDSANDFITFNKIDSSGNILYNLIPNLPTDNNNPNTDELIGYNDNDFGLFNLGSTNTLTGDNIIIGRILRRFPPQVMGKFKNEFTNWVNDSENGFKKIMNNCEMFEPNTTQLERYNIWLNFNDILKNNPNTAFNINKLKNNLYKNYSIVSADKSSLLDNLSVNHIMTHSTNTGSRFNFFLEARFNSDASNVIFDFIKKTKVIVNSTWIIWSESEDINNVDLSITTTTLEDYFNEFFVEFNKLQGESINNSKENDVKNELFNTTDSDDIKLNIYKKIKLIYDKWICGTNNKLGEEVNNNGLYNTFKFIDRSYNDINKTFLINPVTTVKHLMSSYNQSFYSFISKILNDNNMDFFALPAYINYNDVDEMKDIFKPVYFNESVNYQSVSPSFICMYIGERSSNLKLNDGSNFKNDGVDIGYEDKSISSIPQDMSNSNEENKVPIFLVEYGDDNQSIFTNISLDQAEFTVTDESLVITDELTNNRGVGQNLFDIYNSRSYTANVEMLGNSMIQPMMYFQLSHIPMFHGLYLITKVSHSIKSNSMMTSFTGVRVRETKTKMIDASTIFMNLIGSITDVDTKDVVLNINNVKSGTKIDSLSKYIIHPLGTQVGIKPKVGANDYGVYSVTTFLKLLGEEWSKFTKNKNINYPKNIIYSDMSKRLGADITYLNSKNEFVLTHQTHGNGLAIDIRIFGNSTDYEKGGYNINDEKYSRDITRDFLNVLYKLNSEIVTGWNKNRSAIELIYFNDSILVNEFKNNVINNKKIQITNSKGHDNHIHIKFSLPDNLLEVVNDNKAFIEEPLPKENPNSKDLAEVLTNLGYQKGSVEHEYALVIAKKEGYFSSNKTVAPIRNNNPGNLTGISEYKSIDPNVTIDPKNKRFAKFSDIEKGTKALVQGKIINWANGKYPATIVNGNSPESKAYQEQNNIPLSVRNIAGKNVELTFEQFTYIYAPPSENQTEKYINSIVSDLNSQGFNLNRNSKIKDFLT